MLSVVSLVVAAWAPQPFLWMGQRGSRRAGEAGVVLAVTGYMAAVVANIIWRQWVAAIAAAVVLAVILLILWRTRRRRRAPRAYGYKARALIAALARKAREAARPRPALRPVPGGAR